MILNEFSGFPFIDDSFDSRRLLLAVAMLRWARLNGFNGQRPSRSELEDMVRPDRAREVRALDLRLDLTEAEITGSRRRQVADAVALICKCMPNWRALLSVPVEFRRLTHSQAISASSFAWPQCILLSDHCFEHDYVLAEQLVHEYSHQWLYFLEEGWPLQNHAEGARFTLPSGTKGRSASELLGAMHVTANLKELWRVIPVQENMRAARLEHLAEYGRGCVSLVEAATPYLTPDGQRLAERLSGILGN